MRYTVEFKKIMPLKSLWRLLLISVVIVAVLRIQDVLSRILIRIFFHLGSDYYFIPDPGSYLKRGMKY
jgi:hypothetical protein